MLTGGLVALYTTWDAFVIRATVTPFTFIAWFFFLDGLAFPAFYLVRNRGRLPRPFGRLARLGLVGAVTAYFSFGGILLAMRPGWIVQSRASRSISSQVAKRTAPVRDAVNA